MRGLPGKFRRGAFMLYVDSVISVLCMKHLSIVICQSARSWSKSLCLWVSTMPFASFKLRGDLYVANMRNILKTKWK